MFTFKLAEFAFEWAKLADVGVNDKPSAGLAFCPAGYGLQ